MGSNPLPMLLRRRGRSGERSMTCDSDSLIVTAHARRRPAVPDAVRTQHGPGSRAWKARPVPRSRREATGMALVRRSCDRPLLTVRDRQLPVLRARGGHGRRRPTRLGRGGDGRQLGRWARSVQGDTGPRWQAPGRVRGSIRWCRWSGARFGVGLRLLPGEDGASWRWVQLQLPEADLSSERSLGRISGRAAASSPRELAEERSQPVGQRGVGPLEFSREGDGGGGEGAAQLRLVERTDERRLERCGEFRR